MFIRNGSEFLLEFRQHIVIESGVIFLLAAIDNLKPLAFLLIGDIQFQDMLFH